MQYIIITRPQTEIEALESYIRKLGLLVFSYPSITIVPNQLNETQQEQLRHLDTFDWIVFTSRNGVRFFMETLQTLPIDPTVLKNKQIAAVGPKTAEELKQFDLHIDFIPSKFTTQALGDELPDVEGKKILLPRSDLANPLLQKQLEERGATVINIPIYQTLPITKMNEEKNKELQTLLNKQQILCLTFTSPSTVKGFMNSLDNGLKHQILDLPVISIGPVTAQTVTKYGFTRQQTADEFTIEGLLTKLQQNLV
jgi:uroporphyrinogen III methyltransferase/synthase